MFIKLIRGIARRYSGPKELDPSALAAQLQHAVETAARGDLHAAGALFQRYLELDPYNVDALNDLGACYASNGDAASARRTFELAYSLDDSSLPVMVNYANVLREDANSTGSLEILKQAKLCEPRFSQTDTEYARICFGRGSMESAKHFRLRGWLEEFDNLRHAGGYLFLSSYCDIDEDELAAEHLFWASTLRSAASLVESHAEHDPNEQAPPEIARKTRIGYWSPDLRSHAVRYFARPLIENHDSDKFEVFIYHDFLSTDSHTDAIKASAQHFFDVHLLSDADLSKLILSHELDILVELAGHTSYNRLPLLQNRLATLQITALGYPPTTGLETIDAKLLDATIVHDDSARYYSETPLALPTSFWCFDPMEPVPIAHDPPVVANKFITFGCVGNIGKISDKILQCWKDILHLTPEARLLIRSVNFYDEANLEATRQRLVGAGLDANRMDFRKAEGGLGFFETYDSIDIILDTFPFNGGTTSCFAAYMGVPMISWSGQSLLSRMGLSILKNLDAVHLSVDSPDAYVQRALELAADTEFLKQFKRTARIKFENSALGNGRLFAREFERAARGMLAARQAGLLIPKRAVRPLPARELTTRAYAVLLSNQVDAAKRILAHCLAHYPDHDAAHLLTAQILSISGNAAEAENYLTSRLSQFALPNRVSALIHAIRCSLTRNDISRSSDLVGQLGALNVEDAVDRLQLDMYRARCAPLTPNSIVPAATVDESGMSQLMHVVICAENRELFQTVHSRLTENCDTPCLWAISYEHCAASERMSAYQAAMARPDIDILLLITSDLASHNRGFFTEIVQSLRQADVIGIAGALRWERLDWRSDEFEVKFGAMIAGVGSAGTSLELQWVGPGKQSLVAGMAVLDGGLLALNRHAMQFREFDPQLLGADYLFEEDWCQRAHLHGLELAVNRGLGVSVRGQLDSKSKYRASGRLHLAEKMGFEPFRISKDDFLAVSTPVTSTAEAIRVLDVFTKLGDLRPYIAQTCS